MKLKTQYVCQQCNYRSQKWLGKCPDCNSWNSLVEEVVAQEAGKGKHVRTTDAGAAALPVTEISSEKAARISLSSGELNRVLGGGLTRGSVVLLAGDPGVGKSTLLLQILGHLSGTREHSVLYVSGEESAQQIKLRSERLAVLNEHLRILPETDLTRVLEQIDALRPDVVVIDSVQTIYWPELESIPGSISQVREVSDRLVRFAKQKGTTIFLVGHVTKEGGIAGPMALEHLVDTVLFLEGDRAGQYRILRAMKNRFGATDEIGVFSMKQNGMEEVENPSELFLRDRPQNSPGTVVFPAMEGTRPLLVEVQGLSTRSSYGVPMRNTVGFEKNRLTMLLAVLEKRGGIQLYDQDIYVNVVGGVRVSEPAVDLAVLAAVISSFTAKVFPAKAVVFGEVGLAGEVRAVSATELRLKEASKLGFSRAIVAPKSGDRASRVECLEVPSVDRLVDLLR